MPFYYFLILRYLSSFDEHSLNTSKSFTPLSVSSPIVSLKKMVFCMKK